MKSIYLFSVATIVVLSGCTQIVTAPITITTKAVTSTIEIAGATGGAIVNTVTGGNSNNE